MAHFCTDCDGGFETGHKWNCPITWDRWEWRERDMVFNNFTDEWEHRVQPKVIRKKEA